MTLGELVTKFKNNHTYVKRFEFYDCNNKIISGDVRLSDTFMDIFSNVEILKYNTNSFGFVNTYNDNWDNSLSVEILVVIVKLNCYFESCDTVW